MPLTPILTEAFAAGHVGTAFPAVAYARSPYGADSVDASYPDVGLASNVNVASAQGPAGENVVDTEFAGDFFSGLIFEGFGPSSGRFDASAGQIEWSQYFSESAFDTNASLGATTPMRLVALLGELGSTAGALRLIIDSGAYIGATNTVWRFRVDASSWATGTVVEQAGVEDIGTKAVVGVDEWHTVKLQWKCGTVTGAFASVAADGFVKVYLDDVLVLEVTDLDLFIDSTTPSANECSAVNHGIEDLTEPFGAGQGFWGYIAGPFTNIEISSGEEEEVAELMPGFPLPVPHQFFDDNGDPLAGGKIDTYVAGTSTRLATYSNAAMTVENANPIILDANGRASIFISDGVSYKLVVKDADDNVLDTYDSWQVPDIEPAAVPSEIPIGAYIPYGGTSAPSGWLLCDGAAVSRTTYADLFAVIGTAYGNGDGSTTFNVPDMRQRFPLGKAASGTGSTLGSTGGTIDHVHTGPSHTHTVAGHTHTITHTHSVPRDGWGAEDKATPESGRLVVGGGTFGATNQTQANADNTSGASSAANSGSTPLTTDAGGTGNTGTANPPFTVGNFIIRAT